MHSAVRPMTTRGLNQRTATRMMAVWNTAAATA